MALRPSFLAYFSAQSLRKKQIRLGYSGGVSLCSLALCAPWLPSRSDAGRVNYKPRRRFDPFYDDENEDVVGA